jgi:hypothetical protein
MTASIIPLAPTSQVDLAWDVYQSHRAKELADPKLALNRAHMEESARLHERWRRLFLRNERIANVVRIDRGGAA